MRSQSKRHRNGQRSIPKVQKSRKHLKKQYVPTSDFQNNMHVQMFHLSTGCMHMDFSCMHMGFICMHGFCQWLLQPLCIILSIKCYMTGSTTGHTDTDRRLIENVIYSRVCVTDNRGSYPPAPQCYPFSLSNDFSCPGSAKNMHKNMSIFS